MESRINLCAAQIILFGILTGAICHESDAKDPMTAETVAVTILATNLADGGTIGEWGFSALVEVDGRCILFDAEERCLQRREFCALHWSFLNEDHQEVVSDPSCGQHGSG